MKTTYVIRDGKLVEKPKPRPITWTFSTPTGDGTRWVRELMKTYDDRIARAMLYGVPPPEEEQPKVPWNWPTPEEVEAMRDPALRALDARALDAGYDIEITCGGKVLSVIRAPRR